MISRGKASKAPHKVRQRFSISGQLEGTDHAIPSHTAIVRSEIPGPESVLAPHSDPPSPPSESQITPILCPPTQAQGFKLAALKFQFFIGPQHYMTSGWNFLGISRRRFIKEISPETRLNEALSMDFIAKNTTIPVPRVHYTFISHGRPHLVMDYISAPSLDHVWGTMSIIQKKGIFLQLKDFIAQLRALPPPHPGKVEAVDGSALWDMRLGSRAFGPFNTVAEFHTFLGHDYIRKNINVLKPQYHDGFAKCADRQYKTRFSHGDLAPRNILVRDGRIVGIIDWECAGWYPEYWEYTRGRFSNLDCKDFWEMLKEVIEAYPDELDVERSLWNYFVH